MEKKRRSGRNTEITVVTYGFFTLFLVLAGYFIYFVGFAGEGFIDSSYNPRLSQFAKTIVRGDIVASDGTVLATSQTDAAGNETRVYPKGKEYAHIVGFSSRGMSGTELDENFYLLRSHSFFLEKIVNELKDKKNQGDTVVTSLDTKVMDALYRGMAPYKGAAVAIDPTTGKILALQSKPDFDPNTVEDNWDSLTADAGSAALLNRATQGLYPPGSTFKILTTLMYLRKQGKPDDVFECKGSFTYGDTTIHCYHNIVHGSQTLEEAFGNSCNSVFAKIGVSLTRTDMSRIAGRMLFNRLLPVHLKNVKKSVFSVKDADVPLIMQTSIGQGNTLVTPIHMAMLVSALANDGLLMKPDAILRIQNDSRTTVRTIKPEEYGRLFNEEETEVLKRFMRYTVTDGTASKLNTQAYEAYGKTGTAEFSQNKSLAHSWFVGFACQGEEKIAVAIVLEGAGSGSEHAVPLARTIFDTYFQ